MSVNKVFIIVLLAVWLTPSCVNDLKNKFNPKPDASSGVNQIAVLCDDDVWEGPIGDSVRYYFEAPYPILNQPEPQFDLRHFTPQDLIDRDIFRELRAYLVLANTKDSNSPTTQLVSRDIGAERIVEQLKTKSYGAMTARDKWANGQQINYIFSDSDDSIGVGVVNSFPAISQRIRKHNLEVLDAQVFFEGLDRELMDEIRKDFGIEIKIPDHFEKANTKDALTWLIYDRNKSVSNIIFYKTAYTSEEQLTKSAIKMLRDSLTSRYIQSSLEESYMVINDVDLPMFHYTRKLNGRYAVETRGIWEMENDFMGGPFNSFVIVNEQTGELIFIDGFVYAPGERKRDLMQKVTHILETTKIVSPQSSLPEAAAGSPISATSEHH
jgi:hypothetical protein